MGAGKSRSTSLHSIGSPDGVTEDYSETFFSPSDFHNVYTFLDDVFYAHDTENHEWYGEEYMQELRDMGIKLTMDGLDVTNLRREYGFLGDFSDEEIVYMVERFGTQTNLLSDSLYAYQSGNTSDMSVYEMNILQKYLDADLGTRTAYSFMHSLNKTNELLSNKTFDKFVGNLIKDGYGDNILVGMSMETMSMLSRIGIENGVKPIKTFSIIDLNEGNPWGSLGGNYSYSTTSDYNVLQLDYSSFKRSMNDSNYTNWNVAGALGYGVTTVMHEFGHHVENTLFKFGSDKLIKGKEAISIYGNTDSNEAFAESFAAYCLGIEPTKGKEYHSNFKKLMKESGLSAFEGCVKNLK